MARSSSRPSPNLLPLPFPQAVMPVEAQPSARHAYPTSYPAGPGEWVVLDYPEPIGDSVPIYDFPSPQASERGLADSPRHPGQDHQFPHHILAAHSTASSQRSSPHTYDLPQPRVVKAQRSTGSSARNSAHTVLSDPSIPPSVLTLGSSRGAPAVPNLNTYEHQVLVVGPPSHETYRCLLFFQDGQLYIISTPRLSRSPKRTGITSRTELLGDLRCSYDIGGAVKQIVAVDPGCMEDMHLLFRALEDHYAASTAPTCPIYLATLTTPYPNLIEDPTSYTTTATSYGYL
ncbi:hypothetical protein PUNSTDRAFT_133107 [Punctularia strigosozonata HHB-11173 SS5]|uniref:uncharacterized protein n=1 Tax=Punctularia strigosozonata (strain HHB-11173) TaxID=741275 RepID=UPI0004416D66|nr:uncharacterized protein PUNSTDRAFT_133107 [Punctularia strigosozonata HHB-11173 SS5]EIN11052.1 hypothetical protein PUNSTDRAFT_133107 [Punctularia strigosozonata HHB-11173 SS5]